MIPGVLQGVTSSRGTTWYQETRVSCIHCMGLNPVLFFCVYLIVWTFSKCIILIKWMFIFRMLFYTESKYQDTLLYHIAILCHFFGYSTVYIFTHILMQIIYLYISLYMKLYTCTFFYMSIRPYKPNFSHYYKLFYLLNMKGILFVN